MGVSGLPERASRCPDETAVVGRHKVVLCSGFIGLPETKCQERCKQIRGVCLQKKGKTNWISKSTYILPQILIHSSQNCE